MFRRYHQERRHTNIFFVIFRLLLSVVMFAILIGGIYSAYKHFSGLDPLKLDPVAVLKNLIGARNPWEKILGKSASSDSKPADQKALFKFLLIADSHTDNVNLAKAIEQAKSAYPDLKFIIGLGDYSEVGTIAELKSAKSVFDASNLRYFLIPGDHDLWDCRNRNLEPVSCFVGVFGSHYQSFEFDSPKENSPTVYNFKFLLLDNSDDYQGFSDSEKQWIENELERIKQGSFKGVLVFLHEPLFHPSSEHVMGKIENTLKQQARDLIFELKDGGVKKVFAGDTHFFSEYDEPVTGLPMMTAGAVSSQRNPQTPRFAVISVLEDGSIKVEDVIILGI